MKLWSSSICTAIAKENCDDYLMQANFWAQDDDRAHDTAAECKFLPFQFSRPILLTRTTFASWIWPGNGRGTGGGPVKVKCSEGRDQCWLWVPLRWVWSEHHGNCYWGGTRGRLFISAFSRLKAGWVLLKNFCLSWSLGSAWHPLDLNLKLHQMVRYVTLCFVELITLCFIVF